MQRCYRIKGKKRSQLLAFLRMPLTDIKIAWCFFSPVLPQGVWGKALELVIQTSWLWLLAHTYEWVHPGGTFSSLIVFQLGATFCRCRKPSGVWCQRLVRCLERRLFTVMCPLFPEFIIAEVVFLMHFGQFCVVAHEGCFMPVAFWGWLSINGSESRCPLPSSPTNVSASF